MSEIEQKEPTTTTEAGLSKEALEKIATAVARMQIEAAAKSEGANDAAEVASIAMKNVKADIDDTGAVKVSVIDSETGEKLRMENGAAMTVAQFVKGMKASPAQGGLFVDGAPAAPIGKIEFDVNPWHRDHWNLTRQAALLKNEPAYAARLREAVQSQLVKNPWSAQGHNLSRQAEILRTNPELAAKMKAEVQPKENPWLKSQENLTKQVLILKFDKARAERLKAEALAIDGPRKPVGQFIPPAGSFRRGRG